MVSNKLTNNYGKSENMQYLTEETYFTNQQIAEWFGVKKDTLIKHCKEKEKMTTELHF